MVRDLFEIITCQAIRRGSFTSVTDLINTIRTFIDGWNDRCNLLPGPRPPRRSSNTLPLENHSLLPHVQDTLVSACAGSYAFARAEFFAYATGGTRGV